jgi:hypothetical protein
LAAGHPYDELLRGEAVAGQVVFVPELTEAALRVLARLGTASSQQMLVALASSGATELTIRRQAATAFAESVARVGPLLTTDEIALQFDRYNASETADAATQEVLGSLLDTLEGKP